MYVDWGTISSSNNLTIFKVYRSANTTSVQLSIEVDEDLQWNISVRGKFTSLPDALKSLPSLLSSLTILREIVAHFDSAVICEGNPDDKFVSLASSRRGIFRSVSG